MTSSSFRCESAVSHQRRRPTSMLLPFKLHSEGKTRVLPRQGHTPQNRAPPIHPQHRWLCKGCTEEGQKSGSMWQAHWSSGLLELQGWSIQDSMQHRTLDMQDARGNFSSTGSVAAAQTSFLAICCPGPAPASIPDPHAVVGAATGPTGSLLTQEAGGPLGLTFLC